VDTRRSIPSCSSPGYGATPSFGARRAAVASAAAARATTAAAALAIGAALLAVGKPASANQHWNLYEGLPTVIEDAFPRGPGGLEAQAYVRWNRNDPGSNQWELTPRFVWGYGDRMEVRASGTALIGGDDRTGSGDLQAAGLFQFTDPGDGWTPALAGLLAVDLPTGRNTRGVDLTLKLLATSTLGGPQSPSRVHFNVGWTDNDRPRPGERGNRWMYGIGYSQPLGPEMTFVADLVREEMRLGGQRSTIGEVGVRWHVAPATIASVGFGIGTGSGAPDYRLIAGIQIPL
jgi:hypothetical protein